MKLLRLFCTCSKRDIGLLTIFLNRGCVVGVGGKLSADKFLTIELQILLKSFITSMCSVFTIRIQLLHFYYIVRCTHPHNIDTSTNINRPSSAPQTITDANNNAKEEQTIIRKPKDEQVKPLPEQQPTRVSNGDTKKKLNTDIDWNELSDVLLKLDVADKAAVEAHIKGRQLGITTYIMYRLFRTIK
jgi:hypothetical protein